MSNPFEDLDPDEEPAPSEPASVDESGASSDDSLSEPAFAFDAVRQRPLYARAETWDEFEDVVGIAVVPELRKAGIRNEEIREIHDAALRLALANPDRLVELIESERSV